MEEGTCTNLKEGRLKPNYSFVGLLPPSTPGLGPRDPGFHLCSGGREEGKGSASAERLDPSEQTLHLPSLPTRRPRGSVKISSRAFHSPPKPTHVSRKPSVLHLSHRSVETLSPIRRRPGRERGLEVCRESCQPSSREDRRGPLVSRLDRYSVGAPGRRPIPLRVRSDQTGRRPTHTPTDPRHL